MKKFIVTFLGLFTVLSGSVLISYGAGQNKTGTSAAQISGLHSANRFESQVDSILALMTLNEKIGQMNQYSSTWDVTGPAPKDASNAKRYEDLKNGRVGSMLNVTGVKAVREAQKLVMENTRLKIPLIFGYDVVHGYTTTFPIPLAEAASWDLELIEKTARIAAIEATAAGLNWTFAPMVDICRDARWGRVMEGAGEDPYLAALIAAARVKGFQGEDLSAPNTLAACVKHYAAYGGAIAGRDYNTVDMSLYTLFNDYLPPYKAGCMAGAVTFMNSFNSLNGVPATGNQFLVNDILFTRWGFSGFVVSDWSSISEMQNHGYAASRKDAAEKAVLAKCDMDMESSCYYDHLEALVKEGTISEKLIDEAVKRILTVKFQLGLFDNPYGYCDSLREVKTLNNIEFRKVAHEAAVKSIVLLKNQNDFLPLDLKKIKSIAVIGALANDNDSPLGNWRAQGDPKRSVNLVDGLKTKAGKKLAIHYAAGYKTGKSDANTYFFRTDDISDDQSGFKEAIAAARKSDVVVVAIGETAMMSGEGRSRADINLPGVQNELLKELKKIGKPVVAVVFTGRPLVLKNAHDLCDAIVLAWHLGVESGNAIADILFGDQMPSGKLPISFPYHLGQVPIYYNNSYTGRPQRTANDIFVSRYTDVPNDPLYPFGFGLNYTQFAYSNLKLNAAEISKNEALKVAVTIKNIGKYAGEEIAQLYIHDVAASFVRPIKELKGFKKIFLQPQESQEIFFELTKNELSYYNDKGEEMIEPGEFKVFVGSSSVDVLETGFVLK